MMRYVLLALVCVYSSAAFSQISKGNWLAGGNASFNYNRTDDVFTNNYYETTTWQLSPGTGYFFLDNVATGIRVNYRFRDNHVDQGLKSGQQLSLSPFVRYYFLPKKEKVNLFIDAGYIYGRSSSRFKEASGSGVPTRTIKNKSSGYAVAAGPVIFLNKKIALELTITYTKDGDPSYYNNSSTINIIGGAGFQVHLGE